MAPYGRGTRPLKRTTLFTCSIYPDLTRVWHHFAQRYTSDAEVVVLIYDCGSGLNPRYFPKATIVRHPNADHGSKIDHCVRRHGETPLIFLSDDDCFLLSLDAEPFAADALLSREKAAALSLKPREWWEWSIAGRTYPVMGSYSLVFKPSIIRQQALSFRGRATTDKKVRLGTGYYDTADYANEALLSRGYDVLIPDPVTRGRLVKSYSAVSSGFVTLTRKRWLLGGYRPRRRWSDCADDLSTDTRKLEWACGIAATIHLHRRLYREPPIFDDFGTYDDLLEIAARHDDPDEQSRRTEMVSAYRGLLQTLEDAL